MLAAARSIILNDGVDALAHGVIARQLSMSKSAVLYHFPTKQSLWMGLVEDYVEHLNHEKTRHEAAWISLGLTPDEAVLPGMHDWYQSFRLNEEGWVDVGSTLIGFAKHDPTLIEPVRLWYQRLYEQIESSGLPRIEAFAAMMTFDGFFNATKLGIMVLPPKEVKAIALRVLKEAFAQRPQKLAIICSQFSANAVD